MYLQNIQYPKRSEKPVTICGAQWRINANLHFPWHHHHAQYHHHSTHKTCTHKNAYAMMSYMYTLRSMQNAFNIHQRPDHADDVSNYS